MTQGRQAQSERPSLKRHVLVTALGCLLVGAFALTVGILADSPVRALLWIAGPMFLGLGVFALWMLWRTRHIKEPRT